MPVSWRSIWRLLLKSRFPKTLRFELVDWVIFVSLDTWTLRQKMIEELVIAGNNCCSCKLASCLHWKLCMKWKWKWNWHIVQWHVFLFVILNYVAQSFVWRKLFCACESCVQTSLRQFAMLQPDIKTIIEVQLHRAGFNQYKTLAAKLAVLFRMLHTQVCTTPPTYEYISLSRSFTLILQLCLTPFMIVHLYCLCIVWLYGCLVVLYGYLAISISIVLYNCCSLY